MLNKEKLVEFALLNGNIDFCGNGHGYAKNKEIYQYISDRTGVPPELIAAFHYRESGCDFNTYLHNGQKLGIYLSSDLDIVMIMFLQRLTMELDIRNIIIQHLHMCIVEQIFIKKVSIQLMGV